MRTRLDLQNKLEELLGVRYVYYQPPSSKKIEYPAIVFSRNDIVTNSADDTKYILYTRYKIIVISKLPNNPVIDKILELPMTSYETSYQSDNLNHDVIAIYI